MGKKDTITKTLKLRIIRPYNSEEIESFIAEEKNKREKDAINGFKGKTDKACSRHLKIVDYCKNKVESKDCVFCKSRQLDDNFRNELKEKYPNTIFWGDIAAIFTQLQKNVTEIYNKSISQLYYDIFIKEEGKVSAKAVEHYLSKVCYHDAYKKFNNSYLALGLKQKIKSNFRLKELKNMKSALPTAKSDNFPIPFNKQKDADNPGFKIYNNNEDFIVEIPFGAWKLKENVDKYRPWEKYDFSPIQKSKRNIMLLVSTKRRKRNKGWAQDEGTDSEVRKIIEGKYKISSIEITKGKKIGEKYNWMLNVVIDVPIINKDIDKNIVGGIDVGVKNPLVCAVYNSHARYSISDNDLYKFNRKMFARRRMLLKKNRYKRVGHGSETKLKPITELTEKSDRFRKKLIERWACEMADFFIKNKVGVVQMENLISLKRKEDNYFNLRLRGFWPYANMQNIIEYKLSQYGVKTKKVSPKDTSKTCSKCGEINEYFTFDYRKKNKFPNFKCQKCGFKAWADYNAALNISNPKLKLAEEEQ